MSSARFLAALLCALCITGCGGEPLDPPRTTVPVDCRKGPTPTCL